MIVFNFDLLIISGRQRALGSALIKLFLGDDFALKKPLASLVQIIG